MKKLFWLLIALFTTTVQAEQINYPSFKATYKVFRNKTPVGEGQRTAYQTPDGRLYICSQSKLKWFILSDKRKEQSWLTYRDNRVKPLEYQFDRTGTGPNKETHLVFDAGKQQLIPLATDKPLTAAWSADLHDPISYQVQMRMDVAAGKQTLSYPVVVKGKRKLYRFERQGEERLSLPIGEVDTIKLKRIRESSSRETFVWLAKDYDYAVARIWQAKDGEEQADLQLAEFSRLPE